MGSLKGFVNESAILAARRSGWAAASQHPRLRASGHVHAAVDVQFLAGDVAGLRRRQEGHRMGDVVRLAQLAQRDLAQQRLLLFLGQLAASCRSR
jgi:hypothetical protein